VRSDSRLSCFILVGIDVSSTQAAVEEKRHYKRELEEAIDKANERMAETKQRLEFEYALICRSSVRS